MKKLSALLLLFLVGLGGFSTVRADDNDDETYTNESLTVDAFHDDMTEERKTRNIDRKTEDFYKIGNVNTDIWDSLKQARLVTHESLGEEYIDVYDTGDDFDGEYYDLTFSSNHQDMKIEDLTGPQDEEYSAMVVTDEDDEETIYLVLDLENEELLINSAAIDSDQGHHSTEVVMIDRLSSYESGYNEGYTEAETEKEPANAILDEENLVVESEDGSTYNFGTSVYNRAYEDGFDEGEGSDFGMGWIMALFGAFADIFGIELLPGMSIGIIVGITLVPSVILVFLKLFRG